MKITNPSFLFAWSFASIFFASLAHAQGECPYPTNGGIDMSIYPTCTPNPQPTNPSYVPGGGMPAPYYGGGGNYGGTTTPPYSGQQPTGGGGTVPPPVGNGGLRMPWSDVQWPDFNPPSLQDMLPRPAAVVYCENMIYMPASNGRWRVYIAFVTELAHAAEDECHSWGGTPYVIWNAVGAGPDGL